MGLNRDGILSIFPVLISVMQWVFIWVKRLPCTIKDTVQKMTQKGGRINHFYKSSPNSLPVLSSPSSSASYLLWANSTSGDLLGTDSGVFMTSFDTDTFPKETKRSNKFKQTRQMEKKKDYPPPISSRKPGFDLSRNYFDDRLILRHETLKSYEYFESIREDGRLILNLKYFETDNIDENLEEEQEADLQLPAGKDKGTMKENYDPLILDDSLQNGSVLSLASSSMPGSTFIDGINTCIDMHGNTINTCVNMTVQSEAA
ncbi:Uncharacterized protein Adt_07596 [Abeliophyllum distichum]|uniref:FAF domain-containing protein n=1 Tax=Abeliophyllum distichum TaxID=126358 RepID=A0ABD1VCL0_9LAMI